MSDDWHRWTLTEARTRLRARQIGSVELLELVLDRIAVTEPAIRAYVTLTADLALRQARAAQRALDRGDAPELAGVPIALKDLFDVRGVRTAAGSRVLADNIAVRDSTAWARLRRAGGVLMGKLNTHEFAYGGATEPTRNPWDVSRMVGGSSGGSAAALAAGTCFAALGTDTAGSIRIPAALCGVVGLKPTQRAVSTRGVVPLAPSLDVAGPMARTPADVALLFSVLTGRKIASRAVAGLRVGVLHTVDSVESGVRDGLAAAARALADAGAMVREAGCIDTAAAARVNFTIMAVESARVHRHWLDTRPEQYSPYVRDRLRESARTPALEYLDALDAAARLRADWDAALRDVDLLLMSGMPCVAPRACAETIEIEGTAYPRDWLLCRDAAFANVTGHPVLAVPAGTVAGLPVGVQLLAHHGAEHALFPAAQAIFDRLGVPVP